MTENMISIPRSCQTRVVAQMIRIGIFILSGFVWAAATSSASAGDGSASAGSKIRTDTTYKCRVCVAERVDPKTHRTICVRWVVKPSPKACGPR